MYNRFENMFQLCMYIKKNDENIHYKDFASQASRPTCSTFTTVGTNKKYNVYPVTLCMCHVVKFVFTSTQ